MEIQIEIETSVYAIMIVTSVIFILSVWWFSFSHRKNEQFRNENRRKLLSRFYSEEDVDYLMGEKE